MFHKFYIQTSCNVRKQDFFFSLRYPRCFRFSGDDSHSRADPNGSHVCTDDADAATDATNAAEFSAPQAPSAEHVPHPQAPSAERVPHKQFRPVRVLNAPKAVGRSGLASARPARTPRTAPAQDEIMRPFAFACHQLYIKLVRAADGAFHNINEASSNIVKGIRLDDVFKCTNAEGKDCAISVADALYGFRERGGHYTQRRRTHAVYHITNPFEAAQMYALSKGYYLANTSDPSKSLGLRIEVFKSDPKQTAPLWHGQNIQPRGVALNVDLSTPDFEDVNSFYMKPIREAARFVNSTFEVSDTRSEVSDTRSEIDEE